EGKEGPLPAIVLSHSSSLTHAAMAPYAQYLAEQGYAAYCFDFCGACDESKSKGRTTEAMTVFTEMEDLEVVLAKIRTLDNIDPGKIFVLGSSQGGLVTALVAEKHAADIKGMILFYPAFNIPELVSKFSSISGGGDSGSLGNLSGGFGSMGMSEAFVDSIKDYDVYANIGSYPNDVIILHGTNDFIVDIKYSEQAVEKYPSAVLYPIQGASHGFNNANLNGMASLVGGEKDDVVMPYVFRFLAEQ
ncbi:MAG: alpha/beta fold hydrolase, partial [Candidatus Onthovivens sp.]|nr:alpha/beta fold hydrolase [Candidatus Onthovivens sp.]